jgi:hypothetical protein
VVVRVRGEPPKSGGHALSALYPGKKVILFAASVTKVKCI